MGGAPKAAAVTPIPPAAAPATLASAATQAASEATNTANGTSANKEAGFAGTIATSPEGLSSNPSTAGAYLQQGQTTLLGGTK